MKSTQPTSSAIRNILILITGLIIYTVLFFQLYPVFKGAVTTLAFIPVIIGGALFGKRGGLITSIVAILLFIVLFRLLPDKKGGMSASAIPTIITIIITGTAVGWLKDLQEKLKFKSEEMRLEVQKRKGTEENLRLSYEKLEDRVRERTLELAGVNESLVKEIEERKQTEFQLTGSLNEKAVLLKEVHHRVKNNLQIISSLLNIQSSYIEDQQVVDVLKDCQLRVRSIALVHENLYQSTTLAEINVASYLSGLISHLNSTFDSLNRNLDVRISVNVHEIKLGIDLAIPCGLIVNELLSNVYKHAFPHQESGEIRIELIKQDDGKLLLEVEDNGIGLDEDFDINKFTSLGMHLIHSLTDQMNGELTLNSSQGTKVSILFSDKIPEYETSGL